MIDTIKKFRGAPPTEPGAIHPAAQWIGVNALGKAHILLFNDKSQCWMSVGFNENGYPEIRLLRNEHLDYIKESYLFSDYTPGGMN